MLAFTGRSARGRYTPSAEPYRFTVETSLMFCFFLFFFILFFFFFFCDIHTTRGTGADHVIFFEEMAYMGIPLLMTLLPLLQKAGVAMMGISTKKTSSFDLFTILMRKRLPDGAPLFRTFEWKGVCDACEAKGEEVTCEHKRGERPWWLERDDGGFMKKVMEDFYEDFMREMKGVEGTPLQKKVFSSDLIDTIRGRDGEYDLGSETFPFIFTSVDPHGGGSQSEYAIVSMVFNETHGIIVGIDCGSFKEAIFDAQRVVSHINAVREIPGLENAAVIVAAESNLGRESNWLFCFLRDSGLQNFLMMTDTNNYHGGSEGGRIGMTTRNQTKYEMTIAMHNDLRHNRIKFAKKSGVCITPKSSWGAQRAATTTQLENWMRIGEEPKKGTMRGRVTYNGKAGGRSDDAAFALMQCNYAKQTFYMNQDLFLRPSPFNKLYPNVMRVTEPTEADITAAMRAQQAY